jgi:hypothetical protein
MIKNDIRLSFQRNARLRGYSLSLKPVSERWKNDNRLSQEDIW